MLGHCLSGENLDFLAFVKTQSEAYAKEGDASSASTLCSAWELSSHILELLPWELSWVLRTGNYHPYDLNYYGKIGFYELMRTPWNSPSWLSNRRSYYMVTKDDSSVSDAYSKDVKKRLEICFGYMDDVCRLLASASVKEGYRAQIERQVYSVKVLGLVLKCRYYHLLDTLAQKHGGAAFGMYETESIKMLDKENARELLALAEKPPEGVPITFDLDLLYGFVGDI